MNKAIRVIRRRELRRIALNPPPAFPVIRSSVYPFI
jgi:hypothetical protein